MDETRRFGTGLAVESGDIAFDVADGVARLREVSGRENLLQALELRVLTPAGSDRFNTVYGVDYAQIFGATDGLRMTKELIKLNLVRTVATDPRVHDVREILFHDDPEYRADHPEVTDDELRSERRSRVFAVDVVLDTAEAGEVVLSIGIGG
jgi:hypothetical protein